jgi:hypothetical protein
MGHAIQQAAVHLVACLLRIITLLLLLLQG